jgi:hypothetical protein
VTFSSTPLNSTGSVNTMLMSMSVSGGDLLLINGDSSLSSWSMLSSEAVGAGTSVFTLHSCFVGITSQMENEWNLTYSPQTPNGHPWPSSSNRVAAINCYSWSLRSEGASQDHRHKPSLGKEAKMTGKARGRRGTAALAQRRI